MPVTSQSKRFTLDSRVFSLRAWQRWLNYRFNFQQQFLIFFIASSIVPLLIFSLIFLHKSTTLLDASNNELLRTALIYWDEVIEDNLDRLELRAKHITASPITHKTSLNDALSSFDEMVSVYSSDGKNIQPFKLSSMQSQHGSSCEQSLQLAVKPWIKKLHQNQTQRGILWAPGCFPNKNLMLMVAEPVDPFAGMHTPFRFVLLGYPFERLLSSNDMNRMPDDFHFHLRENPALGHSTNASVQRTSPEEQTENVLKAFTDMGRWFKEPVPFQGIMSIDTTASFVEDDVLNHANGSRSLSSQDAPHLRSHLTEKSLVRRIRDNRGNVRGYIIVSRIRAALNELVLENALYILFCLLLGLILLTLLGIRFHRLYIKPIQALKSASRNVGEGDYDVRINVHSGDEQMNQTLIDFNQMLDQIQEKEQLRKTFISTLTHDLRTPLIAQKRVLEFLREELPSQIDEQSGKLLKGLCQSNESLMVMIRHLLENFQFESGLMELHPKPVHLHSLVEQCYSTLRGLADYESITLENSVHTDVLITVDPAQFVRVLNNLVGNSLQNITTGNAIRINAAKMTNEPIEIRVSDTGPGIEPALLPHLFERYPKSLGRQQSLGSGLGLFICKMIITAHSGTITVDSVPGKGTTFVITLPVPPSN